MNVTSQYVNYFLNLYEYYEKKFNTFLKEFLGETDPRTSQWPLTRSPIPLLITLSLYYTMAVFGPKIMRSRKALQVRKLLMVYNISQIGLSSFIMKEILVASYDGGFSLTCQPLDVSMSPTALKMAGSSWWYHISKYTDLLDTVFFVLRKKQQQMSFLHLFHHSTMLFNSYLGMIYIPGGQAIVSTFLNSFVHVVMYWYYLLAAVGPSCKKFLWWKKYLTIIQLVGLKLDLTSGINIKCKVVPIMYCVLYEIQFFTVLAHVFLGSYSGCEVPNWLKLYVICYVSILIVLFVNFYLSSYKKVSLIKMLSCACFQNHLKTSPAELEEESLALEKKVEKELKQEMKLNEGVRRGVNKARSPFTVVNRNSGFEETSEGKFGDCIPDKDKDI